MSVIAALAVFVGTGCDDGFVEPVPLASASGQSTRSVSSRAESDRATLDALYGATDGPNWKRNDKWLTDAPVDEWYGIAADTADQVLGIALRDNSLQGTIPAELGDLSSLRSLDLSGNRLSSLIPTQLGSLGVLSWLLLHDNELSGPLPAELAALDSLSGLWIDNNQLTGVVPTGFRDLPLQFLEFEGNEGLCMPATQELVEWSEGLVRFSGPFCSESEREALRILYSATGGENWTRSDGWLGGAYLGNWHGVETDSAGRVSGLDLSGNGLSGRLPRELGDLASLATLNVSSNELRGPLPLSLANTSLEELGYAGTRLCVPDDASFREWLEAIPEHEGTGTECPALSQREILTALYEATGGASWYDNDNWLTDEPLGEWHGVETDESGNVVEIRLSSNFLVGRFPPELAGLTHLEILDLRWNGLLEGPVSPEFFDLEELRELRLSRTDIGGPLPPAISGLVNLEELQWSSSGLTGPIPPELGTLTKLRTVDIGFNYMSGPIPPELGELSNLRYLGLDYNEHTGPIPAELGRLSALFTLGLGRNHFTGEIPPELGSLANLEWLDLRENELGGSIPETLGDLTRLETLYLSANDLSDSIPSSLSALSQLRGLYVQDNSLAGALPEGIGDLTGLTNLWVGDNPDLSGPVPASLARLQKLESFKAGGTGLCAPQDAELLGWLSGVAFHRLARCELAEAYLTQAVQSRAFPVPLVAGQPALLRVFMASENANGEKIPEVRATFYVDDAEVHAVDIAEGTGSIPTGIDEGSLGSSANADVPGSVIRPGLEMVIEIDPAETLDPGLGISRQIPDSGRMAVDVVELPDFQLTLVPFLYEAHPDSSILEITAGMANAPEEHAMLAETRTLLPMNGLDVQLHDPVLTSTNSGFTIRNETEMIRLMEGRPGYWLSMQGPVRFGLLGVAYGIPSWTSFSQPLPTTVAHELGHNMGLFHAPCGGAGGPDPLYPHPWGVIGSWGYDRDKKRLVSPHTPDLMSYCGGQWISDYHHANALRHRLQSEVGDSSGAKRRSILVWGGLDSDGDPFLEPSVIADALPSLPPPGSEYLLRGTTEDGSEAFSLRFDMPETADVDDERSGFVFAIPVTWAGALERVSLRGGDESFILDEDTDLPITILRDPVTGQVRAILRRPVAQAMEVVGDRSLEVLSSRGVPEER